MRDSKKRLANKRSPPRSTCLSESSRFVWFKVSLFCLSVCFKKFLFILFFGPKLPCYPPSLKNLLGIRRLGQGCVRMRRAWSQRTLFLEPVTKVTAVRGGMEGGREEGAGVGGGWSVTDGQTQDNGEHSKTQRGKTTIRVHTHTQTQSASQ